MASYCRNYRRRLSLVSLKFFSGDFSGVMGSADNSVEIFTYTDCGAHCDDALDVLRQRGIEFNF